ncbi:MAG: hypothetical protein NTW50_05270 [Candidatus Berkelbacteria bacterium]|nr:hypothetical protein [Candidatus Berkelbacteria bacterium]
MKCIEFSQKILEIRQSTADFDKLIQNPKSYPLAFALQNSIRVEVSRLLENCRRDYSRYTEIMRLGASKYPIHDIGFANGELYSECEISDEKYVCRYDKKQEQFTIDMKNDELRKNIEFSKIDGNQLYSVIKAIDGSKQLYCTDAGNLGTVWHTEIDPDASNIGLTKNFVCTENNSAIRIYSRDGQLLEEADCQGKTIPAIYHFDSDCITYRKARDVTVLYDILSGESKVFSHPGQKYEIYKDKNGVPHLVFYSYGWLRQKTIEEVPVTLYQQISDDPLGTSLPGMLRPKKLSDGNFLFYSGTPYSDLTLLIYDTHKSKLVAKCNIPSQLRSDIIEDKETGTLIFCLSSIDKTGETTYGVVFFGDPKRSEKLVSDFGKA